MAVPKEICCCGAYSWAKVIGVIQIIVYLCSLAFLIFALLILGGASTAQDPSNNRGGVLVGPIILMVIGIIVSIVGIVTAVLLIKGANQSNTKYLTIWMVFAAVCYGFKIIEAFTSAQPLVINIIGLSIGAAMYGFGIWAVFVLKREIEEGTLATWPAVRKGTTFPMTVKA